MVWQGSLSAEETDKKSEKAEKPVETSEEPLSFLDEIKQAAQNCANHTDFVYEPTSGLYYDKKTGYYYNAVRVPHHTYGGSVIYSAIFVFFCVTHRSTVCTMTATQAATIRTIRKKINSSSTPKCTAKKLRKNKRRNR